jgi:hypothetical protein
MIFMNIEHRTLNTGRRTLGRTVLSVLAAGTVLGVSFGAPTTNAPSAPDYQSFRIIRERNIFNPYRSGFRRDNPQQFTQQRRADYFALVGTMSYPKGRFAFFDGSSAQYKKVVEAGAVIAGYTVKAVGQNAVTLAANGKEFDLKVGSQLRNQGDNKWQVFGRTEEPADTETGDETAGAEPAAPKGATPEMNEILKRLMERKQQELK